MRVVHGRQRVMAKVLIRPASAASVLLLLTALAVGFVPIRERPREYQAPPGVEKVDCGTVFSPTRWSGDEGCERANTGYGVLMMLLGFFGVCLGLLALVWQIARSVRSPTRPISAMVHRSGRLPY
jgi:hypothetical protein